MLRSRKHRAPRHLEKMLYINHKEEQILQDRIDALTLKSKLREMELDRERSRVRNEWKMSRKKNMTIEEAVACGALPSSVIPEESAPQRRVSKVHSAFARRKSSVSAPPHQRRMSVASAAPSRRQSLVPSRRGSISATQQRKISFAPPSLMRQTSILERDENSFSEMFPRKGSTSDYGESLTLPDRVSPDATDNDGTYILNEFRRLSQVVPGILSSLSSKDDYIPPEKHRDRHPEPNIEEFEPDLFRVTKLVGHVKKMRHQMTINKKLNNNGPKMSLERMIKDITHRQGENDEYTDGACMLMKRKLGKKRRDSTSGLQEPEPSLMRRKSSYDVPMITRKNSFIQSPAMQRRLSMAPAQAMSRSSTVLGFGGEGDIGSQMIGEDELLKRQRVVREVENYGRLKERVDKFLIPATGSRKFGVSERESIYAL